MTTEEKINEVITLFNSVRSLIRVSELSRDISAKTNLRMAEFFLNNCVKVTAEVRKGVLDHFTKLFVENADLYPIKYGDILTIEEYQELKKSGCINHYDGSGCWATETSLSDIPVELFAQPSWATHVVWFGA